MISSEEPSMDTNSMEKLFSHVYESCMWGNNGSSEYKGSSGSGSDVGHSIDYIRFVRDFMADNEIKSVVDAGCGDWRIGEAIMKDMDVDYIGYDVYGDLVNHLSRKHGTPNRKFVKLDSSKEKDKIKDADLLICKDVLQHWDDDSVAEFIDWVVSSNKFKYALITNCRGGVGSAQGQFGGMRGLDANHPLIVGRGFSTALKYHSKDTILFERILKLKDTTLVCIDCCNVDRALNAINKTLNQCSFDKVILFTSLENNYKNSIKINKINSINEYSIFCIKELYKYIETKNILLIQHDGYVVDAKKWKDEFYEYDYVGAICVWMDDEGKGGNGGVSWRSRALLEKAAEIIPTEHCPPEDAALSGKIKGVYRNDITAYGYRSELEQMGFKFADAGIQKFFAFDFGPYQGTFAHHKGNIEDAYHIVQINKISDKIKIKFEIFKRMPSDINEHLDTINRYAKECDHVTEMGVRWVVSTWALLAALPKRLVSYDIVDCPIGDAIKLAVDRGIDFDFRIEDVLKADIENTDMLFIDTLGTYAQLAMELAMHAPKVRKYIIIHDTSVYAYKNEAHYHGVSNLARTNDGKEGMKPAIHDFLSTHEGKKWCTKEIYDNNNGLTVLERKFENNI